MKKYVVILLLFCLLLVGCGSTETEFNPDNAKKVIETSLKNMEDVDDESLEDVYDLDLSKMETHIIKVNTDGDLYAIIKTSEKTQVKNDMKKYFEKLKQFNSNYSPERLEILENRVEKEIGDYLIYIVAENSEQIYDDIIKEL